MRQMSKKRGSISKGSKRLWGCANRLLSVATKTNISKYANIQTVSLIVVRKPESILMLGFRDKNVPIPEEDGTKF